MDALDANVLEIGPVRRLITKAVGQVVKLKPHAVVEVLLECDATDFLCHRNLSHCRWTMSATCLALRSFDRVELRYGTKNDGEEQHGGTMARKIAVEEHCLTPGFEDYWAPTVVDLPAKRREEFHARLTDFGELRLAAMDAAGVARCV